MTCDCLVPKNILVCRDKMGDPDLLLNSSLLLPSPVTQMMDKVSHTHTLRASEEFICSNWRR